MTDKDDFQAMKIVIKEDLWAVGEHHWRNNAQTVPELAIFMPN